MKKGFKLFGIVCLLCTILTVVGCGKKKDFVNDTTWIASDGSEVVFENGKITWYKEEGKHDDNYLIGTYKVFRGSDAVDYITNDLSEYGVTKEELNMHLLNDDEYTKKNFVVFDIYYEEAMLDGKETNIPEPHLPWFGFILEDDTYLDVVNMGTYTYYSFTKK